MKKLLGIVVLGLLWCSFSNAEEMNLWKKAFKLPADIMQGYKNSWGFCCNFDPETKLTPDYAFKFVNKSDGHPVRLGEQSVRFELRRGDCGVSSSGYDDCAIKDPETGMTSERHEISLKPKASQFKKNTWNTYSIYIPDDFPINHFYEHITMGQFHGDGDLAVAFNWNIEGGGYQMQRRTGCHLKKHIKKNIQTGCSVMMPENHREELISAKDLLGKWHDIVFNVQWSKKQKKGYLKQWINGKLVYHYKGSTDTPKETTQFQVGIYRGPVPETPKDSTHVVYYDEIRFSKNGCKGLNLNNLGYSCEKLETQKIASIDHIPGEIEIEFKSLPTMDGKYKLVWLWIDKTMDDREIRKSFIIGDEVTIKDGKIKFDKMNNSKVISNKYREKVSFINLGDKFTIKGSLDLDSSGSPKVTISGSAIKNEKGLYVAEGLWGVDDKKNKKEYIGIFLKPLK